MQTPGELQPIIVSEPFEIVSIDFAGPFPGTENGNKYILVITDLLTRWVDAVEVSNTTVETTVDILEKLLISYHGRPGKLLSDNGAAFTSQLMNAFCMNHGIKQVTMKAMIKAYTTEDQSKWDQHLDMHLYSYSTAKHETLGLSPFEALHRATTYQIGDYVLLKLQTADGLNHSLGLSSAYIGPYKVNDKIGRFIFLLECMDEDGYRLRTTAHINRLKPFQRRTTAHTFSMGEEEDVTPGIGTNQS
ncbi:Transposon Tf2-6 polyprotein [Smittium culicis]|uniref:Transposon Tf2-6 polyprotein n=1 Tax=Smittium culicis TaxID=133412 RepID=A0A1R1WYX2_9FUNG|nr:Transposon Tf2-6 polyprotein [Smittium culicis]